jgi:hypothetical protein
VQELFPPASAGRPSPRCRKQAADAYGSAVEEALRRAPAHRFAQRHAGEAVAQMPMERRRVEGRTVLQ